MRSIIYCYGDGRPMMLGIDNLNDADRGALLARLTSLSPIRQQHLPERVCQLCNGRGHNRWNTVCQCVALSSD